ncbi:MAG: phosphatase PAP2 family protein [Alistipes sp.]|nr:phosphatase PAP2 family protein [Alistipes sp.]
MKELFRKCWHGLFALYIFIYLPWFFYVEGLTDIRFTEIHCFLDDMIPFKEIFIVPYVLWAFYVIAACVFLFFKEERGMFLRYAIALTGGMSIAMIIYMIFPNCVNLRPQELITDNIFSRMVARLYIMDTSTNVFPSIHVLNSIIVCVALEKNKTFKKFPILRILNVAMAISICLSTLFLKQHSVLDGLGAVVLYLILYLALYVPDWKIFRDTQILLPDKKTSGEEVVTDVVTG